MPTDPPTVGQYDAAELMEVLREVEDIMTNTDFNDVVCREKLSLLPPNEELCEQNGVGFLAITRLTSHTCTLTTSQFPLKASFSGVWGWCYT